MWNRSTKLGRHLLGKIVSVVNDTRINTLALLSLQGHFQVKFSCRTKVIRVILAYIFFISTYRIYNAWYRGLYVQVVMKCTHVHINVTLGMSWVWKLYMYRNILNLYLYKVRVRVKGGGYDSIIKDSLHNGVLIHTPNR